MRFLKFGAGAVLAGAAIATVLAAPAAAAAGDAGVLAYPASCFGYTGDFKDGTTVKRVQWNDGSQECFGVAPNRTIWHAWPNSGGWKQMPGNGRADDVTAILESGEGRRMVEVWVASDNTYWCNFNPQGSASWGRWVRC